MLYRMGGKKEVFKDYKSLPKYVNYRDEILSFYFLKYTENLKRHVQLWL